MCYNVFSKAYILHEPQPKTLTVYQDNLGNEPYTKWIDGLRDKQAQRRIRTRIRRLIVGAYGDCEPVGEGVLELRMFFGAGYRVYFGEDEGGIVVLLCGGDKNSQSKDITSAKAYWKDYKNEQ